MRFVSEVGGWCHVELSTRYATCYWLLAAALFVFDGWGAEAFVFLHAESCDLVSRLHLGLQWDCSAFGSRYAACCRLLAAALSSSTAWVQASAVGLRAGSCILLWRLHFGL